MDFRQLKTFSCVAELGSLSKASDTLRIAQPALSRQIKLLEHELRAELFTRNGRGMVLTEAGRLLLARTSGIVRQIDQIRDDIQSQAGAPSGRVVLGLVPTVSCVLSARLARRTVETYPGISLCIVESYSGHLLEWLHRGEMDLAVIYGPSADLHLSVQDLGRDAVVAVGPRGSGLARKKRVEMEWLLRQKLVLPSH
jgi:DNA-binding transcriptional LysR family regulator